MHARPARSAGAQGEVEEDGGAETVGTAGKARSDGASVYGSGERAQGRLPTVPVTRPSVVAPFIGAWEGTVAGHAPPHN